MPEDKSAFAPDFDQDVTKFLHIARERYHQALEDDREDRALAQDDVKFVAGGEGQWDSDSLLMRQGDGSKPARPILTWNRLMLSVNQVCNDGRQNKPGIVINQMDGGDDDTADYFQSRIREIEYQTDADIAYDTARLQAVSCGRAFIKVRTDYKSHDSFEQIIHIDEIPNQFSVVFDNSASLYDRSDADWCFVQSTISRDIYERKYGKDKLDKFVEFFSSDLGTYIGEWKNSDKVVPEVEYWLKTYRKDELLQLQDGTTILRSEYQEDDNLPNPIIQRRDVWIPKVMQYVIDGAQILQKREWIGSTIPIVPLWGYEMVVDGKRRTFSLIRHAKDPQRIVNLTVSNIAELTAQLPKTRYAVVEGQLAGHEEEWEPNSPHLYKQYKIFDTTGRQLPAPVPDNSEPPIQALTIQLGQAIDATKAGTGIFDAALGDRSNETSGKAINARKLESDTSTYHFHDNESRTRKAIGRILLEIIPKIDQGKVEVPVRDIDGNTRTIKLNTPYLNDKGKQVVIRPKGGSYSVAVKTGPSYTSQRQQAFETYSEIAGADQNFMAVAGDVLFRNLDAPGADEIADRYQQGVIPPALRKPKEGEPQIPPEAAQMIQQSQENIRRINAYAQQLEKELSEAKTELKARMEQTRMEIESRERVVALQEETKRTIALADAEAKVAEARSRTGMEILKQQIADIQHRVDLAYQQKQAEESSRQRAMELDAKMQMEQARQAQGVNPAGSQPEATMMPASEAQAQPAVDEAQMAELPQDEMPAGGTEGNYQL